MLEAARKIDPSVPSVLFSRSLSRLAPVQLRSPITVCSRGQEFRVGQILVPEAARPFIRQIDIAEKLTGQTLVVGRTLDSCKELMVSAAQFDSGTLVLDLSDCVEKYMYMAFNFENPPLTAEDVFCYGFLKPVNNLWAEKELVPAPLPLIENPLRRMM